MLSCFTTPCSTSSWYTQTPVSPLSCKNEDITPWWDTSHQTMT
jgi:hypothetical protein